MLRVKNNKEDTIVEVYGDIVDDSWKGWGWGDEIETYPSDVRNLLADSDGDVTVKISSGGGDLFAGVAIGNVLQAYDKGKVTAEIEGLAASAASIIAFCCDEIKIPENAYLMIHKPSLYMAGNANDFRKIADTLDTLEEGLVTTYASKSKIDEEEIKNLINAETWFTGKSASEFFNVKITQSEEIKNIESGMITNYLKTPKIFLKEKEVKSESQEKTKLERLTEEIELKLKEI